MTLPATIQADLKERARRQTRSVLGESAAFLSMPYAEQQSLYRDVYEANYQRLERRAAPNGAPLAHQTAYNPKDATDPANFENRRIEQAGKLAGEFIDSIDFPGFVRDLTHAVFQGNLEVQHAQTDDFIRLLKAATGSLSKFVNEVNDFDAYAKLAEDEPDSFQIALPPPLADEDEDGAPPKQNQTPTLLDRQGNAVDLSNNAIRAKILDTKVAMAQESRALLREVLLMGVTRMIIRKGKIEAACVFDIKAKESSARQAANQSEKVNTSGGNLGGGVNLGPFSFGGGHSSTGRNTQISVSSASGKTSTDLTAKITGSVSLEIESDFFKMDQFAEMYKQIAAPPAAGALAPGAPPAQPAIGAPNGARA
ncbi:hypothetical protein [Solirubrobacter soli]|uniref:hypothetical protein n=1 Tax=Solirubrobacter soli TaxID=363832 RepID=UPI000408274B|nr:hypothetical protein [Solirubrobacter soli]